MHQSHSARDFVPTHRSISSMAVAMVALVFAVACEDNDGLRIQSASGSGGAGGALAAQGGSSGAALAGSPSNSAGKGGLDEVAGNAGGVAGSAGSGLAGSGGVAGSAGSGGIAGSGGVAGSGVAGSAGSGGIAGSGGSGPTTNCVAGGALFVVGNYADATGNQLMLRAAPKAATFALVPAGGAEPSKPPQLFLVNRLCAPGGALIASDGSSNYRVDFVQSGSQLAVCLSAPVPTLDAALALPAADTSHSTSTGCAGHPFASYTTGAL